MPSLIQLPLKFLHALQFCISLKCCDSKWLSHSPKYIIYKEYGSEWQNRFTAKASNYATYGSVILVFGSRISQASQIALQTWGRITGHGSCWVNQIACDESRWTPLAFRCGMPFPHSQVDQNLMWSFLPFPKAISNSPNVHTCYETVKEKHYLQLLLAAPIIWVTMKWKPWSIWYQRRWKIHICEWVCKPFIVLWMRSSLESAAECKMMVLSDEFYI